MWACLQMSGIMVPHSLDSNKRGSLSVLMRALLPLTFCAFTNLMLFFKESMGPQFRTSRQSPNLYFFLSRIHPESVRPLTCTAQWPRVCNCSATWSTFTKTPMPPALKKNNNSGLRGAKVENNPIHTNSVWKGTARLWPASCQDQNLSFVQTFGQQLLYYLLNDQSTQKCIITCEFNNNTIHT